MKRQRLTSVLSISALTMMLLGLKPRANIAQAQIKTQFVCNTDNGVPTTVVKTPRGNVPIIFWNYTGFQGYTPQQRCLEVSNRFQKFYDNGTLKFITIGEMNSQNVICVAESENSPCSGLLLTLRPEANPNDILKELLDVRTGAGAPLAEIADPIYINMDKYLREISLESREVLPPRPSPTNRT